MARWNENQLKTLSEFFVNSAVAWFAAGIISPFFLRPRAVLELLTSFGWGAAMSTLFVRQALRLLEKVK